MFRTSFLLFILLTACGTVKHVALWNSSEGEGISASPDVKLPKKYNLYSFNTDLLKESLADVGDSEDEAIIVQFPEIPGFFKIWETTIVSKKLLEKYPQLLTYKGFNTSDLSTTIRLEIPDEGMHVMVVSSERTTFISPYNRERNIYMVFDKKDLEHRGFWENKREKSR